MDTTDVLVVGAGPTGLQLAGDLATAGIEVTVLERREAERSALTRAFVVTTRTLEEFDARGVADDLVPTGSKLYAMRLYRRLWFDLARLPSRFPYLLVTPQYETEKVLLHRALQAGARVERGVEVTGIDQDADGVVVTTSDGSRRARYVVGADGMHSTVRRCLDEPFPGESVLQSMILADVRFDEQPEAVLRADAGPSGFAFHTPFGDGWHRVIVWNRDNQQPTGAPVTLDEAAAMMRRVYGTDHGMHDPRWLSRIHCEERQVARYRVGRVLLVGDAAHVHSPAGGQGMNAGLQDAANLGWRLVAAIHGYGPPDVLDGYGRERRPVGRRVIRASGGLLRVATTGPAWLRALKLLPLGGFTERRPVPPAVAAAFSGIGIRYPAPRGGHRAVGSRVPDLALTGGGPSRLYEALRGGGFVLVAGAQRGRGDIASRFGWTGPLTEVTAAEPPRTDLLVRPDGYLAMAG